VEGRRSPGPADEVEGFLGALGGALAAQGGRTVVLASADLSHVGPQFGDAHPVTPGQLREVEAADREMLRSVEAGDAEAFFLAVARDGDRRRICGLPPVYAMLRILRGSQGRLLRYAQWPDPNGTVTFASLALYAADGGSRPLRAE
jgi:AmmeMemoRadiSam system protein B